MKKNLLGAIACLSMLTTAGFAQQIQPCGTYKAQEYYINNIPGYKAIMEAKTAAIEAEMQSKGGFNSAAKTASLDPSYTFTIPVVFHILHLGESIGTGSNINDALCVSALNQVNSDYARKAADTSTIDQLFEPLYKNSHIQFKLAKKDPQGNCTNGIVHHYNPKSNWKQNDLSNYIYSTVGTYNWHTDKYLNVYIVNNIISSDPNQLGMIVGYTHLPGTAPNTGADAIVYHHSFLLGTDARSLSHEIGHWLGLSHTFGGSNNAGVDCGNDDIADTPATTGFFSTCPKTSNSVSTPSVTTPIDSSDITIVKFGPMTSSSLLSSLSETMIVTATSGTTTAVDTLLKTGLGTAGSYSDFTKVYPNNFNAGTFPISINSLAKSTDNNYVGVYLDLNKNGSFTDPGEAVYIPTVTVVNFNVVPVGSITGPYTFFGNNTPVKINKIISGTVTTSPDSFALVPATIVVSGSGFLRMRVVTSNSPITGPTMTPASGEFEDYMLNVGLLSCDSLRPNMENIMDYSSCPKMFTKGQTNKMWGICQSAVANRKNLSDTVNLYMTGIFDRTFSHTYTVQPVSPPGAPVQTITVYTYSLSPNTTCGPIADFYADKVNTCNGQTVTYRNTSFNSTAVTNYTWTFDGGTPSTSNAANPVVLYSNPGFYATTLTVSNANGNSTVSKTNFVEVHWNSGQITYPYAENFDSGVLPQNWSIINQDYNTISWQHCGYGSQGTTKSMILPNANGGYWYDNIDILQTPQFNFHNTNNISVSFDYSYARRPGTTGEVFKFQYTTDCGGNWTDMPGTPSTTVMAASGGTMTAPYIPFTQNKWITKTYAAASLGPLNNKSDVAFRFYFNNDPMTGSAQNLYIDQFNISATVGVEEFANEIGLSIYPNPTSSASTIEFTALSDSKVNVTVYDVTGRKVEESSLNASAGQVNKHEVNKADNLTAGVYFITLTMQGQKVTKKLIIE